MSKNIFKKYAALLSGFALGFFCANFALNALSVKSFNHLIVSIPIGLLLGGTILINEDSLKRVEERPVWQMVLAGLGGLIAIIGQLLT